MNNVISLDQRRAQRGLAPIQRRPAPAAATPPPAPARLSRRQRWAPYGAAAVLALVVGPQPAACC